jgi:hypothetical protein
MFNEMLGLGFAIVNMLFVLIMYKFLQNWLIRLGWICYCFGKYTSNKAY